MDIRAAAAAAEELPRTGGGNGAVGAVGASLLAFIVIYFVVFGAGVFYILRLMGKGPQPGEPGVRAEGPIRTAGITPAPQVAASGTQRPQPAE